MIAFDIFGGNISPKIFLTKLKEFKYLNVPSSFLMIKSFESKQFSGKPQTHNNSLILKTLASVCVLFQEIG